MKNNIIQNKTYNFSLKVIQFYKYLIEEKKEYVLARQILRSGTSVGANIEEALGAYSKKEFLSKITISYKEARETVYWLRLFKDSMIVEGNFCDSMLSDCNEIIKIISSIQRTLKESLGLNRNS